MEIIRTAGSFFADNVGVVIFVLLLVVSLAWLKLTLQYATTQFFAEDKFQKEKVRLEYWLGVFGVLVIAAVLATIQLYQNADVAGRQSYDAALEFLSSESPAIRQKSVAQLHDWAKENDSDAADIWYILNTHVKYFTRNETYQKLFPNAPADDVALILKLQSSDTFPFEDMPVDWEYAWLRGADLQKAQLHDAKLQGADLRDARLQDAKLHRASLREAHLQRADLFNAQLHGADLQGAQLQAADLDFAQLQGTYLNFAELQGASLNFAQMQAAYLNFAQMQGAYLRDAQLQGADLKGAELQGADLNGAQLQGSFSAEDPFRFFRLDWSIGKNTRFESLMIDRINLYSEVKSITFEGGLTTEQLLTTEEKIHLDAAVWDADDYMKKRKKELELLLAELKEKHLGDALIGGDIPDKRNMVYDEYLDRRGATYGTYTEADANEWIAAYKEAVFRPSDVIPAHAGNQ